MLISEIERQPAPVRDHIKELCALAQSEKDLALEAERLFGYRGYVLRLKRVYPEAILDNNRLAKVLSELGIPILNENSVLNYQNEALRLNRKSNKLFFRLWSCTFVAFSMKFFISIWRPDASIVHALGGFILFFVLLLSLFFSYLEAGISPGEWQWRELDREYTKPIPQSALRKAIRIKEKLLEADFYIKEFQGKPSFLTVKLGRKGKRFYIEAWDQSVFEQLPFEEE